MSRIRYFGIFRYDEAEHGWAVDIGDLLHKILHKSYLMPKVAWSEELDQIEQILREQGIAWWLPSYAEDLSEVVADVHHHLIVRRFRSHCAFVALGMAKGLAGFCTHCGSGRK